MSDQDVIETSDVEDYAHELSQYRNSIERSRENDLNSAPRQAFGSGRHVVKRVKVNAFMALFWTLSNIIIGRTY
jgi:hypothetical protein